MLLDSKGGPKDVELRTDSHLQVYFVDLVNDGVASHEGSAVGRRKNTRNHREQCGFACAVGAEQSKNSFVLYDQVQVVDCELTRIVLFGESTANERIIGEILYLTNS